MKHIVCWSVIVLAWYSTALAEYVMRVPTPQEACSMRLEYPEDRCYGLSEDIARQQRREFAAVLASRLCASHAKLVVRAEAVCGGLRIFFEAAPGSATLVGRCFYVNSALTRESLGARADDLVRQLEAGQLPPADCCPF